MEYESKSLLGCSRLTHYHCLHVIQNTFDPCRGRKRMRVPTVNVKQLHKTSLFIKERTDIPGSIVSALSSSQIATISLETFIPAQIDFVFATLQDPGNQSHPGPL